MSLEDSLSVEDSRSRQPVPHPKRSRGTFAKLLAVSLAVASLLCLLGVILLSASERRRITAEMQRVTERHRQLQMHLDRLERAAEAARHDREVILSVLAQCRRVEDLSAFDGSLVAARRRGIEETFFYVPAGTHRFAMQIAWQPSQQMNGGVPGASSLASPASPATLDDAGESDAAGQRTVSIPLQPDSGYHFHINRSYKPGPVTWELTSNHPEFETKRGQLPLPEFRGRGYSTSGSQGIVRDPSSLDLDKTLQRKTPVPLGEGLSLSEFTLRGEVDDRPYRIPWKITLHSDVPLTVSAQQAGQLLARGYPERELVYQGDGRYGFRDHRAAEPTP